MLEKLLRKALAEVEKEINKTGIIDDSDCLSEQRFLDKLATQLIEAALEDVTEDDYKLLDVADELLEMIKDEMHYKHYSERFNDECYCCYYKNENELKRWLALLREEGVGNIGMQQIPNNYLLASDAEREYGLYAGAIRQAIFHERIKPDECTKIAGRWFVSRQAVERVYKKRT